MVLFDFATAFPSIVHEWIFLVLEARGLPKGLIDFFQCVYFLNCALTSIGNSDTFLLWYFSGVLQGCPGSAFIFNVILDPLLAAFAQVISLPGRGIVRACADDIGAALTTYKSLAHMFPIFESAENIAGLTLKPAKCNVVPTSEPMSEFLVSVIRQWLRQHIPKWADINILPAAKYLGFYLGPKAGEFQWEKAIAKYLARCSSIGLSGVPASLATFTYNQKGVSVLLYLAQFASLPHNFNQYERTGLSRYSM